MKLAICAFCYTGHCGKQVKQLLKNKKQSTLIQTNKRDIEIESNRVTK